MLEERRALLGDVDPARPISEQPGRLSERSHLTNRMWLPFRKRGYEWVTFHTLLDEAGLTARQIADVLGHAHPSMTLNN